MGSMRRMTQKGRRRSKDSDEGQIGGGPGQAVHAPIRPVTQQYHNVGGQAILPTEPEVMASIRSLYADELKPFGRILRKRIAERAAEQFGATTPGQIPTSLPDVDIRRLREVCEESKEICVTEEDGGDWSALLSGYPEQFVNVYSPQDVYPPELWDKASLYFSTLSGDDLCLPGGRYACAQALVARNLPFLSDRSLGQICHIVQLAISQKRILGYYCGAVVPYSRSQSMVKEWCAFKGAPCTPTVNTGVAVTSKLRMATWDTVREHMQAMLQSAASPGKLGSIPLSNVKRLFRSRYQTELSETMLGHSKLSELLQDPRLHDICSVQLQGHGYLVLQNPNASGKLPAQPPQVLAPAQGGYPAPAVGALPVSPGPGMAMPPRDYGLYQGASAPFAGGSLPQPARPQRKLNAPLEASLKNAASLAFARAQGADEKAIPQGAQPGGEMGQTDVGNTDWRERLLEEMIASGGQVGAAVGDEDSQQKLPRRDRQPWRVEIGSDSPLRRLSPNRHHNPAKYADSGAASGVDESQSPVKAAKPWMLWPSTPDTSPDALNRFYRKCPAEGSALTSGDQAQSGRPLLSNIHSKQPPTVGASPTRRARQQQAPSSTFEYEERPPWPDQMEGQSNIPAPSPPTFLANSWKQVSSQANKGEEGADDDEDAYGSMPDGRRLSPTRSWHEDEPMKVPITPIASQDASPERRAYGGAGHGYIETPSLSPDRSPSRYVQFRFPDGPPQEEAEDRATPEGNSALPGQPSPQQMRGDYSPCRRKQKAQAAAAAAAAVQAQVQHTFINVAEADATSGDSSRSRSLPRTFFSNRDGDNGDGNAEMAAAETAADIEAADCGAGTQPDAQQVLNLASLI